MGSVRLFRVGRSAVVAAAVSLAPLGCIADGKSRPPGQRVTSVSKELGEPQTYLDRPGVAAVTADNFDTLWQAVERKTRDAGFSPDREDYRLGIFTTKPVVSAQFFEFWRHDVASVGALAQSSLGSIRRTVHWEVERLEDETFRATPKVLVERWSLLEHRVTFNAHYQEIFALTEEEQENQRLKALDPAAFAEEPVPAAYWYPIGRDEALERRLAAQVRDRQS